MSGETTASQGGLEAPRAIVADDDPMVRRLLRDALEGGGFNVLAEAPNGREAVEQVLKHRPDIVLMDVNMPELDGVSAVREIHKAAPEIRQVLLTHSRDEEVALDGLEAGASGFLTKDLDIVRLPDVLREVLADAPAVSPGLTGALLVRLRELSQQASVGMRPVRSDLTSREWEVLDLLCSGLSDEAVASELVLSGETVRTHVKSLHRKLDVHSRAELIEAAARLRQAGGAHAGSA
jgi:DNA-binding NarL/FixJ family response regulator